MLTLSVFREDVGGRWTPGTTGWQRGSSHVTPYAHPSLQTLAIEDGRRTAFIVRERSDVCEDDPGPRLCLAIDRCLPARFDALLEETAAWPLDHLTVEVAPTPPQVRIRAGARGTAPLYLTAAGDCLHGDFRYEGLYCHLDSLDIDRDMVAHHLMGSRPYGRRTLLRQVQALTERAEARWDGTLTIEYPVPAPRVTPGRLRPNADPVGAFGELLSRSIDAALRGCADPWGAELSGGADSACIALAAARSGHRFRTYGLQVTGPAAPHQRARRRDLVRLANASDCSLAASEFPPLSLGTRRMGAPRFSPGDEIYTEAFDALLERARADGIRRMFTGIGGDELFLLHAHEALAEPPAHDTVPPAPDYLTRQTVEGAFATRFTIDHAPRTAAPRSALLSLASRAPVFLRQGIWPMSPLTTPELVTFCRRLPRPWREGKHLARQFLMACGCHRQTAQPRSHESFLSVYRNAMQVSANNLLQSLFKSPRLAELGLVDRDRLVAAYAEFARTGRTRGTERFYEVATVELMLRRSAQQAP